MKYVLITPCKGCVLAEISEKASAKLNQTIRQTKWLSWKHIHDVNGKDRLRWYIAADTTEDKENRLMQFAALLCEEEGYEPSSRICPHDLYYEDYEKYFLEIQIRSYNAR